MIQFPAEWEPQSFIQFTFPHQESDWGYMYNEVAQCFARIIETVAQFEPVLVGCKNVNETASLFTSATSFPIHFVVVESNDTWARDHGAITIMQNGKPTLLDFTFNGWGQKFESKLDNQITLSLVAKGVFGQTKHEQVNFVLEGGAVESDGLGTLLTTSECLLSPMRNPHLSKSEIEDYLKAKLGLHRILWLDHGYLAGDDTDSHIDTLARFCSPDIIAYVKCNDPGDEHFEALEKMEVQLKTFTKADGKAYELVPLPWPEACFDSKGQRLPATYANFLIVNGAVLVPTYNVAQDQEALEVIQKCFPDRKVVGVDCRPLIEQHGSLHCITMQYPKSVKLHLP